MGHEYRWPVLAGQFAVDAERSGKMSCGMSACTTLEGSSKATQPGHGVPRVVFVVVVVVVGPLSLWAVESHTPATHMHAIWGIQAAAYSHVRWSRC